MLDPLCLQGQQAGLAMYALFASVKTCVVCCWNVVFLNFSSRTVYSTLIVPPSPTILGEFCACMYICIHLVTCVQFFVIQDRVPTLSVGTAVLVKFGIGEKANWREGQ